MAGIPSEHVSDVREALRSVAADPDLGPATLSDSAAMSNLLKDLLPDAPREKNLLVAAAEARLAEMMLEHAGHGIDARSAVRLAAASFGATTLYSDEVCLWVARELAIALGLAPELTVELSELPPDEVLEQPVTAAALDGTATATAPPTEPLLAERPVAEVSAGGSAGPGRRLRRVGPGQLLMLAGLAVGITGYAVPVFNEHYYGGDYWITGLGAHVTQASVGTLLVAAASVAAILLAPRRTGVLAAASAVACASGFLMGAVFWWVYSKYVGSYGDLVRPGLVTGLIGAALVTAGGAVALLMFLAGRAGKASPQLSRGPR